MTIISRQIVREAVASLIRSKATIAQAVYEYMPSDFGGASPVVTVTGSSSERPRMTLRGAKTIFHLVAETWVLYADPNATPPWTERDAENTLDALEAEVARIVEKNSSSEYWSGLFYETASAVSKITIGGVAYLYEAIPLIVEVL